MQRIDRRNDFSGDGWRNEVPGRVVPEQRSLLVGGRIRCWRTRGRFWARRANPGRMQRWRQQSNFRQQHDKRTHSRKGKGRPRLAPTWMDLTTQLTLLVLVDFSRDNAAKVFGLATNRSVNQQQAQPHAFSFS